MNILLSDILKEIKLNYNECCEWDDQSSTDCRDEDFKKLSDYLKSTLKEFFKETLKTIERYEQSLNHYDRGDLIESKTGNIIKFEDLEAVFKEFLGEK